MLIHALCLPISLSNLVYRCLNLRNMLCQTEQLVEVAPRPLYRVSAIGGLNGPPKMAVQRTIDLVLISSNVAKTI